MLLIGCFTNSIDLEQALASIEQEGIERRHIMAVGMKLLAEQAGSTRESDAIEVGMAWATACAVIGAAAGFGLAWGPIVWGLAGTAAGFGLGYGLKRIRQAGRPSPFAPADAPEVTVIVQCPAHKSDTVRSTMYRYGALSVGATGR